jgi:signal transduction histidine kinase/ActR/RegA family two-component response regulator
MKALPGRPADDVDLDPIGDRYRLLRIGMVAVFSACVVFASARLMVTLSTGRATPWLFNALGAGAVALLFLWYRRNPATRSSGASNGMAVVATVALLAPIAYGMPSTIWWLSLVGFAMILLGRSREARAWAIAIPLLVIAASLVESAIQIPGSAGETETEKNLARFAFSVLVVGMAAGFRRVANERAAALSRANAARGRFLAHVSHEIRTPLHGVLSMTELALKSPLTSEAKNQLETAQQSARVLLGLLNNILDVTRAESDAMTLDSAPFDLHAALGDVLRPLAAEAAERRIAFAAHADPGIPRLRRGDRYRVAQIALNLVGNALKFTREGRIDVALRIATDAPDSVSLTVADSGPGIEAGMTEAVFEPFSQGTATGTRRGSGLGLAIVRDLTRRMGGSVTLRSEPGLGSVFTATMRLPVEGPEPGPVDLLAAVAEAAPPVAESDVGRGLRVLVCEDEPVNRKVAAALLRKLGYEATLVPTAEDAWSVLEKTGFDVLLTDIELPGMDGIELTRRLRERERELGLPRLPILAGTAHVGEDERHRLLAAGLDGHVPKPFGLRELREALEAAIKAAHSAPSP